MFNSYVSNTLEYDPKLCINCGMCSTVCPHGVFMTDGNVAQLVNPGACMECGACQINCPTKAIKVDSGVGCASAMMRAAIRGQKEATCDGGSCCDPGPVVLQIGEKED
ncbi:Heterodisulfide reductase subunit A-like protein [uncultured archaeon]|nr:Heterodisulfide reductase subunit A-like protein [uncultured archaeon]